MEQEIRTQIFKALGSEKPSFQSMKENIEKVLLIIEDQLNSSVYEYIAKELPNHIKIVESEHFIKNKNYEVIAVNFYTDMFIFLTGRLSFASLISKISESYLLEINKKIENCDSEEVIINLGRGTVTQSSNQEEDLSIEYTFTNRFQIA